MCREGSVYGPPVSSLNVLSSSKNSASAELSISRLCEAVVSLRSHRPIPAKTRLSHGIERDNENSGHVIYIEGKAMLKLKLHSKSS